MEHSILSGFGQTAKDLSKGPLGIIALFIVLVYGMASFVVTTGNSLTEMDRLPIIYFLVGFPVLVLGVFTFLVVYKSGQLYPPSEFRDEKNWVRLQEIQKIKYTAVGSLALAKQTKDQDRSLVEDVDIDSVAQTVESAFANIQEGILKADVLWVDDNPGNNVYERKALESVGIRFVLVENTQDALQVISKQTFSAIISDMGRREGPREGYKLLDTLRARGNKTPLFFFATSNTPQHKLETNEHGGQGCTNDSQELFEMVTDAVLKSAQKAKKRIK